MATSPPTIIIIMTATVYPSNFIGAYNPDPHKRLAEYKEAISAAGLQISTIENVKLFVSENSGWGRKELEDHCHSIGAELFCDENDEHAALYARMGKGAAEIRLISRTLDETDAGSGVLFMKLTGRLQMLNLADWVKDICEARADLYSHISSSRDYSDSRAFGFSRAGFASILSRVDQITDSGGHYLEHILAETCKKSSSERLRWAFPRRYPVFHGYGGTLGTIYKTNRLVRLYASFRFQLLKLWVTLLQKTSGTKSSHD